MCRYLRIGNEYATHWACLGCRYTTKCGPPRYSEIPGTSMPPCPMCREPMVDLGRDFRAPRRTDRRQWRKVALLYAAGIRYESCGCRGPGPRPRTFSDAASQQGLRRSTRRNRAPSRGKVPSTLEYDAWRARRAAV